MPQYTTYWGYLSQGDRPFAENKSLRPRLRNDSIGQNAAALYFEINIGLRMVGSFKQGMNVTHIYTDDPRRTVLSLLTEPH
jgi:hypothetical protein